MTRVVEKDGLRFAAAQPAQPEVRIQVPDSYVPPPEDPGLAWDRVVEVARHHPEAVAISDGSIRVTYADLVDRARRVAGLVLDRVGEGEAPIAILMDNGADLVAVILGTLASGRAYLPLDPTTPPSRLTRVIEQSRAGLLVASEPRMELGVEASGGRVPVVSVKELPDPRTDSELPTVSPDAPARLVYTSGSTGEPKGVPRSHGDLTAITNASIRSSYVSQSDHIALLSPLSFGMANGIMWASLLAGARLCLYDLRSQGVAGLANWLIGERITHVSLVPSVLRALAAACPPETVFEDVRCIRVGGDRSIAADFVLFRKHFTDSAMIINTLGASEVGSIAVFCANRDTPIGDVFPIGYPARPDSTYLIGSDGEPVEDGAVGEIVVWRQSVLGYWNDPDRSSERFISDPAGGFRYHTGDLAIRRPDGCLEFVGRKDLRVKIDGQAVEIAEVEDALLRCDLVEVAAVAAVEDRSGGTRLVGYVTGGFGPGDREGIRAQLAERLPPYMIPATLMQMDAMPWTDRGKVDRSALPAPAWAASDDGAGGSDRVGTVQRALTGLSVVSAARVVEATKSQGAGELIAYFVPVHGGVRSVSIRRALTARLGADLNPVLLVPVDELPAVDAALSDPSTSPIAAKLYDESTYDLAYRIASFFEEVLGATVDLDDSFFDLGGTSLQAMAVFGKIDAAYGVNLSPTTIVDAPTPRSLADVVQGHSFRTRRSSLVAMQVGGSGTPLFHVHGGRGHVLHLHGLTQYADPDRPVYGFEQPGLHGRARPLRTVERMAQAYVADLQAERPYGPYALMGHSFGGMVALEMARRLVAAGEEVPLLTIFDTKFSHLQRPTPAEPIVVRRRPLPRRIVGALRSRFRHWRRRTRLGVRLRLGKPIAYDQRTLYFFWLHVRAARRFRPKPYSGRVLVIAERGSRDYHERVWNEVAPGSYEIIELPVEHNQIIEEPYIVDVMREVEARIDG